MAIFFSFAVPGFMMIKLNKNLLRFLPVVLFAVFILWLVWPVEPPFEQDYSTLIYDSNQNLLRATLNENQQFCFPPDSGFLPDKYVTALLLSEDKRFYRHLGVDLLALANSVITNIRSGKRIRGASTITMQVVRVSCPRARNYLNKFIECLKAVKLSVHFSKEEILRMYGAHVPMGGNVIGIQAASYFYFGKPVIELTWAEAALFVVLPNSPSMINLSRKRSQLLEKRNRLILKLYEKNIIDKVTADMACLEPLPEKDSFIPFEAPHFCEKIIASKKTDFTNHTTLDAEIQNKVKEAASIHYHYLSSRGIDNLAVIVAETETGKIRAYLGSHSFYDTLASGQVDGVRAFRSTGSLLKPFLTAKVMDRGSFTLISRIQDVPSYYGTFVPQNANKRFNGLVTLEQALIHSLNVPCVRLLNSYGLHDFYDFLIDGGLKGLFRGAEGYGLTLILGGAEASLWELTRLYLSLANTGVLKQLRIFEENTDDNVSVSEARLFSEGSAWLVLNSLKKLHRPGSEYYWREFNNQVPVAWKTGTSYGQKDGWAIGVNRQWVIGVWAGNFNGQGNASLSGAKSAAPLLFSLFNLLCKRDLAMWYEEPEYDLVAEECCKESGFPAGPNCTNTVFIKRAFKASSSGICPFHKKYLVDKKSGKSVCSLCWDGADTRWETRFIVPAPVKDILLQSGKTVDAIPTHAYFCPLFRDKNRFDIIYPIEGIKIFIPRDYDGRYEKLVLSVRHQHESMHLFWFLNDFFIGETVEHHQLAVEIDPGEYELIVQDEEGFTRSVEFLVYKKDSG